MYIEYIPIMTDQQPDLLTFIQTIHTCPDIWDQLQTIINNRNNQHRMGDVNLLLFSYSSVDSSIIDRLLDGMDVSDFQQVIDAGIRDRDRQRREQQTRLNEARATKTGNTKRTGGKKKTGKKRKNRQRRTTSRK
jgi:hypothetical protein